MLFTLLACAGLPIAYPPTALHAVELTPLEEGAVSASAGVSSYGFLQLDAAGGAPDASLAVGLPGGLSLRGTAAAMADTTKGTLTLGWDRHVSDKFSFGVQLGAAASHHAASGVRTEPATTTAAEDTEIPFDYTYWNVIPELTLRNTWQPTRFFGVSSAMRYSRSMVVDLQGTGAAEGSRNVNYVDFGGGPVFTLGPVRIGPDVGFLFYFADGQPIGYVPAPRFGLAVRGDLGVWGPARAAQQ